MHNLVPAALLCNRKMEHAAWTSFQTCKSSRGCAKPSVTCDYIAPTRPWLVSATSLSSLSLNRCACRAVSDNLMVHRGMTTPSGVSLIVQGHCDELSSGQIVQCRRCNSAFVCKTNQHRATEVLRGLKAWIAMPAFANHVQLHCPISPPHALSNVTIFVGAASAPPRMTALTVRQGHQGSHRLALLNVSEHTSATLNWPCAAKLATGPAIPCNHHVCSCRRPCRHPAQPAINNATSPVNVL